MRTCVSLSDVFLIRQFLLDSYVTNAGLYNWEPRRWEGLVFHRNDVEMMATRANLAQNVGMWIDSDGNLEGVVIPEYPGGVFLQSSPGATALQREMLEWAIAGQSQAAQNDSGSDTSWLEVWISETDSPLQAIATDLGFVLTSNHQIRRHQVLEASPSVLSALPAGYAVRGLETEADYSKMAALLNAAFGRDFHSEAEYRNFATLAPSYRPDLEIVVVAPDGNFAAHAGFTAHLAESFVVVEPVCTHADHQNLGLARIAMTEGLNRCRALGIRDAYIEAWYSNPVSNHVYQQMGFINPVSEYIWRREV
jgi:GNAT superfamily N-acetyltransferase